MTAPTAEALEQQALELLHQHGLWLGDPLEGRVARVIAAGVAAERERAAVPGREALSCIIYNAAPDRFMRFSQCYPIADAILAAIRREPQP